MRRACRIHVRGSSDYEASSRGISQSCCTASSSAVIARFSAASSLSWFAGKGKRSATCLVAAAAAA